jgi:hypothetical protein
MLQRLILLTHYFSKDQALAQHSFDYYAIIQEHNSPVKQGSTVAQHLCIHTLLINTIFMYAA